MNAQPDPASPDQDGIAAYLHPELADVLLCREHGDQWPGLIPLAWHELPSVVGFCSWGTDDEATVCGRALLKGKAPTRRRP